MKNYTYTSSHIDKNDFIIHYYYNEEGLLHKTDGPAVDSESGYAAYYINGMLHNENGPAIIYADGNTKYYTYGNRHWELDNQYIYGLNVVSKALLLL